MDRLRWREGQPNFGGKLPKLRGVGIIYGDGANIPLAFGQFVAVGFLDEGEQAAAASDFAQPRSDEPVANVEDRDFRKFLSFPSATERTGARRFPSVQKL